MNQSSVMSPNTSHPMKKKIITALVAVVIGHTGVLWALSHMQSPELKKIEKEPLQVRFVKIQQAAKPPEPPQEVKKQPPPPPKEVKVVETPIAPPPPKVEKIQQVKQADAAKPVVKAVETPVKTVETPVPVTPKVVEAPKPVATVTPPSPPSPPVVVAPPVPPSPPAPVAPKTVSIGGSGVQWSRTPKPSYTNKDLQGESRSMVVAIEANEKGVVTSAYVTKSSGIPALDEKILRSVRNAKFKPYKENGIAYPFKAEQPFELTMN